MRVLFVTSECAGVFKLGGLGDVSYSLPVALNRVGVYVAVVMPYYERIKLEHARCVGQVALDFDRRRELVFVFESVIAGTRVPLFLFRHPLLHQYHSENMTETFAFFSKAVAQFYLYAGHVFGGPFDIIHGNDWHTALIPLLLGEIRKGVPKTAATIQSQRAKTVLTVHNFLYQGEAGEGVVLKLGTPRSVFHISTTVAGRSIKFLREGFEYADIVTTVSPTYAAEIRRGIHGDSIREVLKKRGDILVGILNGIDASLWDPSTDPALPARYNRQTVLKEKPKIKTALRRALRLSEADVPLFGFVGRLEPRQKGIDLIESAVKILPKESFQLALLGTGAKAQVARLEHLAVKYRNISFTHTFDERLARRIYAGADVMLIPSKFEPSGLTQMIAMRYGTLPLVRKTGGLADTVDDKQTGFVFGPYTRTALVNKMEEVIRLYQGNPSQWYEMMKQAMRQDFSWKKRVQDYIALYRRLLASKS